MTKRKSILVAAVVMILALLIIFVLRSGHSIAPGGLLDNKKPAQKQPATPSFDKTKYSTTQTGSIWIVVNKHLPLSPLTYVPADLVVPNIPIRPSAGVDERRVSQQMSGALETMVNAAKAEAVNLMLASGYRSYQTQVSVYGNEVKQYGQAQADRESAKPGYSEHQTGLAADLEDAGRKCEVADCFANTAEGKWLAANAYKYGFIIRYTKDKESVTGYRYEPWHVRYVGTDLSNELHKTNIETLEEFFNL